MTGHHIEILLLSSICSTATVSCCCFFILILLLQLAKQVLHYVTYFQLNIILQLNFHLLFHHSRIPNISSQSPYIDLHVLLNLFAFLGSGLSQGGNQNGK